MSKIFKNKVFTRLISLFLTIVFVVNVAGCGVKNKVAQGQAGGGNPNTVVGVGKNINGYEVYKEATFDRMTEELYIGNLLNYRNFILIVLPAVSGDGSENNPYTPDPYNVLFSSAQAGIYDYEEVDNVGNYVDSNYKLLMYYTTDKDLISWFEDAEEDAKNIFSSALEFMSSTTDVEKSGRYKCSTLVNVGSGLNAEDFCGKHEEHIVQTLNESLRGMVVQACGIDYNTNRGLAQALGNAGILSGCSNLIYSDLSDYETIELLDSMKDKCLASRNNDDVYNWCNRAYLYSANAKNEKKVTGLHSGIITNDRYITYKDGTKQKAFCNIDESTGLAEISDDCRKKGMILFFGDNAIEGYMTYKHIEEYNNSNMAEALDNCTYDNNYGDYKKFFTTSHGFDISNVRDEVYKYGQYDSYEGGQGKTVKEVYALDGSGDAYYDSVLSDSDVVSLFTEIYLKNVYGCERLKRTYHLIEASLLLDAQSNKNIIGPNYVNSISSLKYRYNQLRDNAIASSKSTNIDDSTKESWNSIAEKYDALSSLCETIVNSEEFAKIAGEESFNIKYAKSLYSRLGRVKKISNTDYISNSDGGFNHVATVNYSTAKKLLAGSEEDIKTSDVVSLMKNSSDDKLENVDVSKYTKHNGNYMLLITATGFTIDRGTEEDQEALGYDAFSDEKLILSELVKMDACPNEHFAGYVWNAVINLKIAVGAAVTLAAPAIGIAVGMAVSGVIAKIAAITSIAPIPGARIVALIIGAIAALIALGVGIYTLVTALRDKAKIKGMGASEKNYCDTYKSVFNIMFSKLELNMPIYHYNIPRADKTNGESSEKDDIIKLRYCGIGTEYDPEQKMCKKGSTYSQPFEVPMFYYANREQSEELNLDGCPILLYYTNGKLYDYIYGAVTPEYIVETLRIWGVLAFREIVYNAVFSKGDDTGARYYNVKHTSNNSTRTTGINDLKVAFAYTSNATLVGDGAYSSTNDYAAEKFVYYVRNRVTCTQKEDGTYNKTGSYPIVGGSLYEPFGECVAGVNTTEYTGISTLDKWNNNYSLTDLLKIDYGIAFSLLMDYYYEEYYFTNYYKLNSAYQFINDTFAISRLNGSDEIRKEIKKCSVNKGTSDDTICIDGTFITLGMLKKLGASANITTDVVYDEYLKNLYENSDKSCSVNNREYICFVDTATISYDEITHSRDSEGNLVENERKKEVEYEILYFFKWNDELNDYSDGVKLEFNNYYEVVEPSIIGIDDNGNIEYYNELVRYYYNRSSSLIDAMNENLRITAEVGEIKLLGVQLDGYKDVLKMYYSNFKDSFSTKLFINLGVAESHQKECDNDKYSYTRNGKSLCLADSSVKTDDKPISDSALNYFNYSTYLGVLTIVVDGSDIIIPSSIPNDNFSLVNENSNYIDELE